MGQTPVMQPETGKERMQSGSKKTQASDREKWKKKNTFLVTFSMQQMSFRQRHTIAHLSVCTRHCRDTTKDVKCA